MRDEQDLNFVIELYADTIKRICILYLKNVSDTEDIFQNVFLKYWNSSAHFENEEHRKAWFIRVSINECKDLLKLFFRKNVEFIETIGEISIQTDFDENAYVREAVMRLPDKYKAVIYLHYFEGYPATTIAKILNKNVNTIYTILARGREMLRSVLGDNEYES